MRRALLGTILLAVAAVAAASATPAANDLYWPQWRGPQLNGVAPMATPPLHWSETENVAWKVEVPGSGYSTPIIWGDRVFVLTAVPVEGGDEPATAPSANHVAPAAAVDAGGPSVASGGPAAGPAASRPRLQRGRGRGAGSQLSEMAFTVMALDRADGSVLWSREATREAPHEGKQANNSWASASAVTDGEHVFAYFGSRGLFAYDMEGNRVWEVDFGAMRIRNGFGEGTTPALHGDRLVIVWDHQGDSFIVALDKRDGREIWRRQRDEPESWATPLVVDAGGVTQVVTAGQNRTRAYHLETGELIWEGEGLTVNPIPSPVAADGIVYLMSGYRGYALRAVRLSAARGDISGSPAILWEYNQDTSYVPSPLLYDGKLYFLKDNSPILTVFDAERGEPLYGRQRLEGLQEIYASPVGAAGRVYIVGRDGAALVLENGSQYRVLASNSLDDGFEASPALVGSEMYLRGRRFLYRIEEQGAPDPDR